MNGNGMPARQKGAVLIIALVVLVVMTLSALSLIHSVNTTNLISGNLAFRESAVLSAESATEIALNGWLIPNSSLKETKLHFDDAQHGYRATRADPADGESWETFWEKSLTDPRQFVTVEEDVAGNVVSYVIHRLCESTGTPLAEATKCVKPPIGDSDSSRVGGNKPSETSNQVYYRITSRVSGPRNTVVYTQTIVAL
ncbi:MAG: hypothetical protein LBI62_01620 [Candidatus Accumulibacter sp.]|jgi:Tfp pilus assembly protein PilX|nr:hypothetical protein [Accumulibacter sp.]